MADKKYKVVLLNELSSNMDRDQVVKNLATLFKTTDAKIEKILNKPETTIKKDISKETAEKFYVAIRKAGASCALVKIDNEDDLELPDIKNNTPTIKTPSTEAKHDAPSLQEFSPLKPAQNSQLSLEAQLLNENQPKQDISDISATINEDCYCPECGTIKATADSVCKHCNHDPVKIRKTESKARIKKILGAIFVSIIISSVIGIPAFNYFSQKIRVENGLLLAFETRNQVTAFIETTNFWPNQNIDANLPKLISNDVIESIVIGDKSILTISVRASITGDTTQTLVFTPKIMKGKIVWNCLKGDLENRLRPDSCKLAE